MMPTIAPAIVRQMPSLPEVLLLDLSDSILSAFESLAISCPPMSFIGWLVNGEGNLVVFVANLW
jgi:hypothetical protein